MGANLALLRQGAFGFYRRRARERDVVDGRGGSVTFVQRFGSTANLNLHAHAIVLDGVFAETPDGELHFHRAAPPSDADVATLIATIRKRILRHLERRGFVQDDQADPFSDESPLLASCYATSIAHRQTLGRPGARLHRLGDPDAARAEHRAPMQAHIDRFDLHAGLCAACGCGMSTFLDSLQLAKDKVIAADCARDSCIECDDSDDRAQNVRLSSDFYTVG